MIIVQIYIQLYFEGIAMNAQHTTENLTVHFKVQDYAKWRAGYDARETNRRSAGITNGRVFCNAQDPNDVVVLQDVGDAAKARTFFATEDQKAAMQRAAS
jgi:hypothetical protein